MYVIKKSKNNSIKENKDEENEEKDENIEYEIEQTARLFYNLNKKLINKKYLKNIKYIKDNKEIDYEKVFKEKKKEK